MMRTLLPSEKKTLQTPRALGEDGNPVQSSEVKISIARPLTSVGPGGAIVVGVPVPSAEVDGAGAGVEVVESGGVMLLDIVLPSPIMLLTPELPPPDPLPPSLPDPVPLPVPGAGEPVVLGDNGRRLHAARFRFRAAGVSLPLVSRRPRAMASIGIVKCSGGYVLLI
jgi:hypothetical protein